MNFHPAWPMLVPMLLIEAITGLSGGVSFVVAHACWQVAERKASALFAACGIANLLAAICVFAWWLKGG